MLPAQRTIRPQSVIRYLHDRTTGVCARAGALQRWALWFEGVVEVGADYALRDGTTISIVEQDGTAFWVDRGPAQPLNSMTGSQIRNVVFGSMEPDSFNVSHTLVRAAERTGN